MSNSEEIHHETSWLAELEALRQEKRVLETKLALAHEVCDTYEKLGDSAPIAYHCLGGEGHILRVNNAWLFNLGYRRDEVLGRFFNDFLANGQPDWLEERLASFRKGGSVTGVGCDLVAKDGSVVSFVVDGRAIRDARGNLRTHFLLYDVQGDRTILRTLEEAQLRQKLLFQDSPAPTIVIDPETGEILDANGAALRQYEYSHSEITGLKIWDINKGVGREKLLGNMQDIMADGARRFQFVHHTKSGRMIDVEVNAALAMLDGRPLIYSTVLDITEQVQAKKDSREVARKVAFANEQVNAMNEQLVASNAELQEEIERRINIEGELREREVLLRSIFRAVPMGIGLAKNRVFHWTNVTLQEMLGRSSEELEGQSTRILYASDEYYDLVGQRIKGVQDRGVDEIEVKAKKRTGEAIDLILHIALINPEDESAGVVFSCMDVTERNRVQAELVREKDRAEIASRTKNEFLANMSHEIRTPLNGVMGMLQLLQTTDLDGEQEDYVTTALSSSRGLLVILNDILDLSIIEAGKMDLKSDAFAVGDFAENVVKVFRHQATEKQLALNWYVHPEVPRFVIGDKGRLRQVLFNLLGNAIKFTPEGEVCVEIYPLPGGGDHAPNLLVVVSDTGIGISEENLEHVFEAFTQVDGSFTRDFQGTGLGLGIVKRLVELMGGSVGIESELGEGTSVLFCLPLDVPARDQDAENEPMLIRRFPPGVRVLVVEDSRPNRIMVMRFLSKLGVSVASAENGKEALALLQESESFHCILMDVQMPVMDGMEATERIRQGHSGSSAPDVPIVALTAHAMKGDREMFLASGMDAYLSKPVDIVDLGNLLSRLIRGTSR